MAEETQLEGALESALPPPAHGPATERHASADLAWRWVLGAGWVAILAGMIALADMGRYLGKGPWWEAQPLLAAALPLLVVVGALYDKRQVRWVSVAAAAELVALPLIDIADRPGVAAVGGMLGLIAVLVTVGGFLAMRDADTGSA